MPSLVGSPQTGVRGRDSNLASADTFDLEQAMTVVVVLKNTGCEVAPSQGCREIGSHGV